jgi:hypothetical protein
MQAIASKENTNKGSQMGHTKNIFKKRQYDYDLL